MLLKMYHYAQIRTFKKLMVCKASQLQFFFSSSPFFSDLDKFQECNIDKRPASAFVTKVDAPAATVEKIQDILKAANVTDLKTGGLFIVSLKHWCLKTTLQRTT